MQDHRAYESARGHVEKSEEERKFVSGGSGESSYSPSKTSTDKKIYQIQGSRFGNGTRTYQILSNGTTVYETHYDGNSQDANSRSYEYEDALNREYERRRQEAAAAAAAAAAGAAASASASSSMSSSASSGTTRSKETYGGDFDQKQNNRFFVDGKAVSFREHEEALRREYEIKRQEAEAAARELERIRLESEASGSTSYNARLYETIEALRAEYEKKRLEAEAAAAAAAAAARGTVKLFHKITIELSF